jgi:hypothetical protein
VTKLVALALGLAASLAAPAGAEVNPFNYSYTAAVEERGETELSLWATERRGKKKGHYDAQDYRIEAEHGLTDRLQVSGYLNFSSHHVHGLEPAIHDIRRDFGFSGASVEFKYQLLKESRHGVGLAIYAEPGWSRIHDVEGERGAEYELELKTIVSKSFAGGRLLWAGNLTFEPEWERASAITESSAPGPRWEKELKIGASSGLAYRVAPDWFAGVEARYASVYPDWTRRFDREAYAVSMGPTIAFQGDEWSAGITWLPRLFGGPARNASGLDEFEKSEIRLRVAHEF